MSSMSEQRIAELTGASSATRGARIQSVWSGYGEVVRFELRGVEPSSVVVKHVVPGRQRGRSHERKLRSYQVEQAWYRDWSPRLDDGCRVARCLHVERTGGEWLFVLEDLQAAGFVARSAGLSSQQRDACLRWLAAFHARFLGQRPEGLWTTGTYWHLGTRPDEHRAMAPGRLRDAATAIDRRLAAARFQTLVHGDAKPANFCFSADGRSAAAVDFQYVGGGCGVKDVAYLLAGEDRATTDRALDTYFEALRLALRGRDFEAVEAEWRALYAWAWADFHRFLSGWAPGWRCRPHERTLTQQVLALLS